MVKFLILRFSSIGDIILTTPVVRHLKEQVEDAEIHYLTKAEFAPLLESNPHVDVVHSFDGDLNRMIRHLRGEGIDYIIDLHHNARSARIKWKLKRMDFTVRKLNLLKWIYVNFKWNRLPGLHMVDRNLETIRNFINEEDGKGLEHYIPEAQRVDLSSLPSEYQDGYVGLAIGAQHGTKKLPDSSLVELCRKFKHPVVILGGQADHPTGEEIIRQLPGRAILNGCGNFDIHQSASLVRQSRLLVTHDTGLMHLGAAFGKKIISIWGNTVPEFGMYPYRADPSSVMFQVQGLKCRPCSKIGYKKCPKNHFRCMLDQDLDGIADTANRLFEITAR